MNLVSVYRVTRRATGDSYIGISNDPELRWKRHLRDASNGEGYKFHRALAKYGSEAFDFDVIAALPTPQEAKIAERILIALEKPEYNLTAGGDGTWGPKTPEQIAKIAAANRGQKRSPETCARIGASKQGTTRSAETRAKMSAAHQGRQHTEESRAKMRANWGGPRKRGGGGGRPAKFNEMRAWQARVSQKIEEESSS